MKVEQLLIAIVSLQLACNLHAQSARGTNAPPAEPTTMNEVVVTASPIIQANRNDPVAGQVTSVSQQQIEDLNAQDLPSALRMTPGVVVSRHNPVGSFGGGEGGAVFIRGHGSSRPGAEIGMFVDGVPKFASVWAHPLMDTMNIDMAERIDVYKGAQPVLFGNMTFGAINIIPKRMTADGDTTALQLAYGSYNTWVETAERGGKSGPLDYYLNQSFRTSDGHRDNADGQVQDYTGQIGYAINENWSARLLFESTQSSADDPGPDRHLVPLSQVYSDGHFEVEDYFTVATISHAYEAADGYVKFYWDKGTLDWSNQFNPPFNKDETITSYDNYGIKARETFHLWEGGQFMVGCDADFNSGKAEFLSASAPRIFFDRTTFEILSPHMSLSQQFDIAEDIYVTPSAGFRWMLHNEFNDEAAPQAGVLLHAKDTEFHMTYSRGVNYPGIFAKTQSDMWMPGENDWQSLAAETVNHYEIGISQALGKKVKVDCNLFYDAGEDRIVVSPPPPFPPVWRNIGETTSRGVEATVTVTPIKNLSVFTGLTYLNSDPSDLPYNPEWSASAGSTYRFLKHWRFTVDASFMDDQFVTSWSRTKNAVSSNEIDSYVLVNARLGYDFAIPTWKVTGQVFAAAENLLNTEYEQKFGYPMPGINGMFGIKLRL